MSTEVKVGDQVQVMVDGKLRVLRIETMSSNRQLAQCSFTERSAKHYVMCQVRGLFKLSSALAGGMPQRV